MTPDSKLPPTTAPASPRKLWEVPAITELPRLTDLTLQSSGIPGGGFPGGGSTVFP